MLLRYLVILVLSISGQNQLNESISSGKPVVVDFWTDWCHSCKTLEPTLQKLALQFGNKIQFIKINADENPEIAQEYGVHSYPTLVIFKNGEVAEQIVGAYPENALKEILENHI